MDLALLCEAVADELPGNGTHITLPMRRAANSVHSNIAEGNGRFSRPDYLRHLSIANASLRELESNLCFAERRFGKSAKLTPALTLAHLVAKLLGG